jgi:hypothetical protein
MPILSPLSLQEPLAETPPEKIVELYQKQPHIDNIDCTGATFLTGIECQSMGQV